MRKALVIFASLAMTACAGGDWDDPTDLVDSELINGSPTQARPEIGYLGGCTATLIRPNVVISASHCHGYSSRRSTGNYGSFRVHREGQEVGRWSINLIETYSRQLGENDVALLHLSESVPESAATPTRIADRSAENGEEAVLWGYGCTSRSSRRGQGVKRNFTYAFGDSNNLCPGDSGGPGTIGQDGPVFLINSGYWHSGSDIFGEPWQIKQRLQTQIRSWEETYGAPVANRHEITVTNQTGQDLWVRCAGDDSATCSWWVTIPHGGSTWIATPDNRVMLDNKDFVQGGWDWFEATAPGDAVTVYDNQAFPFYEPGTEPEDQPAPDPEDDPAPDPEDDPAPDPDNDPAPDPGDEPAPDPDDAPGPDPEDNPGDNPGDNDPGDDPAPDPGGDMADPEGGAWVDAPGAGEGLAWADDDPTPTAPGQAGCSTVPNQGGNAGWLALALGLTVLTVRRSRNTTR